MNTGAPHSSEGPPARAPQAQLALPAGRADGSAWLRAVAFAFLAWATVLFAAVGSVTGAVTQTLAGNLAANALHLQRQAGPSSATRAARRDHAQSFAKVQLADKLHVSMGDSDSGALPTAGSILHTGNVQAEAPFIAGTQPRLKPRYNAHPSRAPPALA